ncbi:hypothetical protein [Helicobacter trogontum]|uniref:hypothetical protein n=1 Tax=Helicobacter trogontum TaxID=50960 RepID=UPI000CF10B04|nr:hypothetical protein [Helicobacter trogontum]
MEKVMYGVSGVLFLALCFISWRYVDTLKKLENESYKNVLLESKLDTQNKAIEKLKLDTQSYKENKEKQEKEIQDRYAKALTKTQKVYINTCDLQELERLKRQELQLSELLRVRYE